MNEDRYIRDNSKTLTPPDTLAGKLKFLGPSFILSASIVGSGELIATTTLGAKAGFTAFWIIIASCLVKVALQLEFGRHTILTGQTAMQSFNQLGGPRLGKGNWSVWAVFLLTVLKLVQVAGIMGSAAIVLLMVFPGISIEIWTIFIALLAAALVYKGYYPLVEKLAIAMIALFTLMTLSSLFSIQYTPYQFSLNDVLNGLTFQLSPEDTAIAIGAFGITGVASDEIIAYNYWCIEKGYGAYTGKNDGTESWMKRAKGWIKIMHLDAIVAMVIYTAVTAAFYLLGAAILHGQEMIPQGNQVIETLAQIYTDTLGDNVKVIFLIGAFFVLFSSLFSALAAWSRMFSDIFSQLGWIDFNNLSQRKKIIALMAFLLPAIWATLFLFIELPVIMVISGGIVGSVLLFVVVYAGWHFRYRTERIIPSSKRYDAALWISILSIMAVGVIGIVKLF